MRKEKSLSETLVDTAMDQVADLVKRMGEARRIATNLFKLCEGKVRIDTWRVTSDLIDLMLALEESKKDDSL